LFELLHRLCRTGGADDLHLPVAKQGREAFDDGGLVVDREHAQSGQRLVRRGGGRHRHPLRHRLASAGHQVTMKAEPWPTSEVRVIGMAQHLAQTVHDGEAKA
jgi:hypothetical protein